MKYKEIVSGMKVIAKTKYDMINAIVLGFKPNSYTKVEVQEIGEDKPKRFKHGWMRGTFEAGDLYTIHIDDIYPFPAFRPIESSMRTLEEQKALEGIAAPSQHNSPIAIETQFNFYGRSGIISETKNPAE